MNDIKVETRCRICGDKLNAEDPTRTALEGTKHLMEYHKVEFDEYMKRIGELFNTFFETKEEEK